MENPMHRPSRCNRVNTPSTAATITTTTTATRTTKHAVFPPALHLLHSIYAIAPKSMFAVNGKIIYLNKFIQHRQWAKRDRAR